MTEHGADWRQQEELEQRRQEEVDRAWNQHEQQLRDLKEIQREIDQWLKTA